MTHGPEERRYKVLIVDDYPKNIQVAANILKTEGYRLYFAQDGETALSQVESNRFDLILLDIMMPGIDGLQVCQKLKQNPDPTIHDVPVIFLTAKSETEDIVKGLELGAVDYVTKPFNGAELLARVKTHLELRRSKQELKDANATKDKFFSIVAHDLRNPLQSVLLAADMLDEEYYKLDEKTRIQYIKRVSKNCHHLTEFLENLLEWSRSQRGLIKPNPKPIDLGKLTAEGIRLLSEKAENKIIMLTSRVEDNTVAYADRNMIKAVILNLLSNAVKFTHNGGSVTVTSQKKDGCSVITVSDTGVGIKKENIGKLFNLDTQVTTPGTEEEKGTGLGLILSKEFIEKNNGTIHVESEPGRGSRFTFRLPQNKKETH